MFTMPRRRYRLFTVCAVVIVFMLYRVVQNSWNEPDGYKTLSPNTPKPQVAHPLEDNPVDVLNKPPVADLLPSEVEIPEPVVEKPKPALPNPKPVVEEAIELDPITGDAESEDASKKDTLVLETDEEAIKIPDLKDHNVEEIESDLPEEASKDSDLKSLDYTEAVDELARPQPPTKKPHVVEDETDVHWKNPPKDIKYSDKVEEEPKHWKKPTENFPLPPGSVIPLPTGKPKEIPKIQYSFGKESEKAKATRLQRQKRVKAELTRAWAGYKKFAWMHDELSPVSVGFRDPFCGWAATLVDSLDTLWIAGMKEEFAEAAQAVEEIDFTTSPRNDIPVFETTIRYLGGLLAAYDVSGGAKGDYPILLEKAVELAEILMGIFDTPNRMPVLYYRWRPPYSSQPHRASVVGMAEMATLSMEFTRLAQITGKDKYHDAVDRITNALVEMQKVGTTIPGLFPERIDASGCNKSATTEESSLSKQAQKQMDSDELLEEPLGYGRDPDAPEGTLEDVGIDADIDADTAPIPRKKKAETDDRLERRMVTPSQTISEDDDLEKKDLPPSRTVPDDDDDLEIKERPEKFDPTSGRVPPLAADGSTTLWDCVPQGLVQAGYGHGSFHVGGAQDSAYEYFPKQYLLLGGLEPKYKKLHEDAIDAIYDWLLFRPMIKDSDDWDILFPARVSTAGDPDEDLVPTFEVTHLTCFVGGMFGLGGKIFNRERDIETAKQLTDGCVWAYQSTISGLMPEVAHIMPCDSLEKCQFNETKWWETLDPSKDWREEEMRTWEKAAAEEKVLEKDSEDTNVVKNLKTGSQSKAKAPRDSLDHPTNGTDHEGAHLNKRASIPPPTLAKVETDEEEEEPGSELPDSLKTSLKDKLDVDYDSAESKSKIKAVTEDSDTGMPKLKPKKANHAVDDDAETPEAEETEPPSIPSVFGTTRNLEKPMSHKEYVQHKIRREGIPPGYTSIVSRKYILRPEAIESVWYMYRITGDPTWMDKGWAMFEATITATRTEFANSAIDDVLSDTPRLKDEMESFWIAETLKYYYLLFSEPDLISLDDWVLNTEAHPFKRPS